MGGVVVIGAVTAVGYYLGNIVGKPKNTTLNTTPSPSAEPTDIPSASPLPTASPSIAPTTLPTAPPQKAIVKGSAISSPNIIKNVTNPTEKTEEISIRFVDIPSKVSLGESFSVGWYVSGPEGKIGTYTKLSTSRKVGTSSGVSSSYSSSETSQSFGEFRLPQKFVSKTTLSGDSGSIEVQAVAEVGGKIYTTTRSIALVN